MAVVPGDERRRGPGALEVFARNPEAAVGLRTDRVEDGVVQLDELVVGDVPSHLDVAEEAEARPRSGLLERARDGLDVLVVRPDTQADEAVRRRQTVEQVDLDRRIVALQECVGGVEPGRPRPDDRDSERAQWAQVPQPAAASGASPSATWKLEPHPHAATTFGLSILKPDSCRPSRKSIVAPCRYGALNGSMTTLTPWNSSSWSPACAPRSKPRAYSK